MVSNLIEKDFFSLGYEIGWNAIIVGVDMSSSPHIDNKKKNILILRTGPAQALEHTLWLQKNCIQSTLPKIMQNFV